MARTRKQAPVVSSASSSPTGSSSPAGPEGGDPVALRRHRADVERNRKAWAAWAADYFDPGVDNWMAHEPTWGIWRTPESELGLLDEVVTGTEAIDLGCGTGYVCAWLARLVRFRSGSTSATSSSRTLACCRISSGRASR